MQEATESEELQLFVSGVQQEGDVLRVPAVSSGKQGIAGVLFSG